MTHNSLGFKASLKREIISFLLSKDHFVIGQINANVNQKICQLEFLTGYGIPQSILLLATIGAKLIGPHGVLQVGKKGLLTEQA